jgi:hypothetical protein
MCKILFLSRKETIIITTRKTNKTEQKHVNQTNTVLKIKIFNFRKEKHLQICKLFHYSFPHKRSGKQISNI